MRVKTQLGLVVAAAIAFSALAVASPAGASHVRPKGATPLRDPLFVAQQKCAGFNTTHNTPPVPAAQSCTPPSQVSSWLTVGTPDVNGAGANSSGYVQLVVMPNDVNINFSLFDVRCLSGTAPGVCTPANAVAGEDYVGQLQLLLGLQITDHFNTPSAYNNVGTAVLVSFPVNVPCAATGSTALGATCQVFTSMNALVAGSAVAGKRTVYEIPQGTAGGGIQVFDGGQTGVAGSSGATLFAESGVFVP